MVRKDKRIWRLKKSLRTIGAFFLLKLYILVIKLLTTKMYIFGNQYYIYCLGRLADLNSGQRGFKSFIALMAFS